MSETESAHGTLAPVDRTWNAQRFLTLFVVTLGIAFVILFVIASLPDDFGWDPFAHDLRHSLESSSM
jgi:hypothetical protein